jgi:tripartite-type tricarboxylate transporter receptor subunit TctC
MLTRREWLAASGMALGVLATGARPAFAQDYPNKPVRMIVPYPPGGATDTLARLLGQRLEPDLKQSIVIDNRGGGASQVGTQAIATATPDGYTIGMIDSAFTINPGLFGKLPYDTKKDFIPVSLLAIAPLVMVVHPSVQANSALELVALAKAQPGKLSASHSGLGTPVHLACEQFRQSTGIDIVLIPYRGAGPSIADFIGGQVQFTFGTIPSMIEHIRQGRARPIGMVGARSPLLPNVPTLPEAGLPNVDAEPIFGMAMPAGTPQAIVAKLHDLAAGAVKADPFRQRLIDIGFAPVGSTPEAFAARIDAEITKWTRLVETANIKPN